MSVAGSTSGLAAVDKHYREYGRRARELKQQGQRIIGYLCAYVPLEIIHAAGFVPFRIKGNVSEPISKADTQMETIVCPLVRSCFDMTLKGSYDFLEGLVIPHACDSMCRTYDIWKYTTALPYSHFINMPHATDDSSLEFFKAELNTFKQSLEKVDGEIPDERLARAVRAYNDYRARVRGLMELRSADPPLISGAELAKTLIAGMSLLEDVTREARKRAALPKKPARIMLVGAQIDDAALITLIEDTGAWVTADDICPGSREYWSDVAVTGDPMDGIAERYLRKIYCGRTYRQRQGSYPEYLEERFGHIGRGIKHFQADGIILYFYKYCDPYGFEVPAIKLHRGAGCAGALPGG
jgi:benzoyl-CoA reductase/2-hydroxyglutaryl-CoA dehydratase subunit BcrC/BadD/HgdB